MRAACCAQGSPRSDAPKKVAAPKVEHSCTTCGELMPSDGLERHPMLPVATCTRCVRYFLCDGQPDQWARYENGKEKYCSWCAHNDQCHEEGGGVIVECAREGCPKIFCKACIVRNFGDEHYQKAKADANWQCYGCEPGALRQLPSHEVVAGASSRAAAAPAQSASAGAAEVRSLLLRLRFAQPNSRAQGRYAGAGPREHEQAAAAVARGPPGERGRRQGAAATDGRARAAGEGVRRGGGQDLRVVLGSEPLQEARREQAHHHAAGLPQGPRRLRAARPLLRVRQVRGAGRPRPAAGARLPLLLQLAP